MRHPTALLAALLLAAAGAAVASTGAPALVASVPWSALETRDHHHAAVLAAKVRGRERQREVTEGAWWVGVAGRARAAVSEAHKGGAPRPRGATAPLPRIPPPLETPPLETPTHRPTPAPPLTPGGPPWARRTRRPR